MFEDAASLTAATRRDTRRRTRIAVAVYAVCLVTLLAIGSYLAPSGTIAAPNGTSSEASTSLQAR